MPQIASGHGIRVYTYYEDHQPPHFHAYCGEFEVVVEIAAQKIIRGSFPRSELARIKEWAVANTAGLEANWLNAQAGATLNRLPSI